MARKKRPTETVSTGSTADIAFLLLIFFLVTTTIVSEQGLTVQLPPKLDEPVLSEVNERNIFTIMVNSQGGLLVEKEPRENLYGLQEELKAFILNEGRDEKLSDSPQEAIISLKSDRGTSYQQYIALFDEIKGAYYHIYSDRLGVDIEEVRNSSSLSPILQERYERLRRDIPMRISLAEPTDAHGAQ